MISKYTVFAVDDEPDVLELYKRILVNQTTKRLAFFDTLEEKEEEQICNLYAFESGESYLDELQAFYAQGKRVAVSIVDMRLPNKHGLEIAKEARTIDPEMTIIIVTAYSDFTVQELIGQLKENVYYLHKPFRHDELYILVTSSLKNWDARVNVGDITKELAVDATQDGIWDWNPQTNEIYFSPRWKAMLGYKESEIKNNFDAWHKRIHPEDVSKVMEDIEEHLQGKSEYYVNEHRLLCKDGNYKWILARGKALFNEEGLAYRFTGFHTNISERKRLEEELLSLSQTLSHELKAKISTQMKLTHTNADLEGQLKEEIIKRREKEEMLLQQTRQAAMGEMISMIAHQWRQPLTTIGLSADNILLSIDLGEIELDEIKESLYLVRKQVKYLSQTIDDFRNFFVPNKTRESVLIQDCLKGALSIIENSLVNNGITIEKNYDDTFFIPLYKNELIQVFLNLLKNAQDVFHDRGIKEPKIAISTKEFEEYIEVAIADNGGGIPKGVSQRIFEPYFTTKGNSNGTGLGLYMSKTIIEEHCCGTITATNNTEGAEFKMTFPKVCQEFESAFQ